MAALRTPAVLSPLPAQADAPYNIGMPSEWRVVVVRCVSDVHAIVKQRRLVVCGWWAGRVESVVCASSEMDVLYLYLLFLCCLGAAPNQTLL